MPATAGRTNFGWSKKSAPSRSAVAARAARRTGDVRHLLVGIIVGGWLLPGRKRVVPYNIQWLKRLKPALFRQDLTALFALLRQQKIKPLGARRFPLAEARQAQELLGQGDVTGRIVLVCNGSSLASGAA